MLERSNDGKSRQHKAMTASRPFADGMDFSASERIDDGKHLDHTLGETAFRSAVAGSISQRLRGKHFSSLNHGKHQQYCWHFAALSPEAFHIVKVDGKHFAASERINDGKHQPIAGRLDHSPMGGISQRQSESMTGSIDLLSASRSLAGERHFTAP